jgi:opacity protein-like surface antigen
MAQTRREAAVAGFRLSILVTMLVAASASAADAQPALFTGLLTAHVGAARSGDVGSPTTTGGASMAVVDANGLGAEIDIGHTGAFDKDFFADSSATSFMVNFIALYPHEAIRPFVDVGVGIVRLRTSILPGQEPVGNSEAGWNAGGGLFVAIGELFAVRGDVRYFRLFDRPADLVLRDDGFFDYWRTSVGVTFTWPIR